MHAADLTVCPQKDPRPSVRWRDLWAVTAVRGSDQTDLQEWGQCPWKKRKRHRSCPSLPCGDPAGGHRVWTRKGAVAPRLCAEAPRQWAEHVRL